MYKDCFEESVTLLGPDPNSSSLFVTPNALFSSTTLNTPSEWKVNAIDSLGRVSFTPKDPSYNFILDWNSIDQFISSYTNKWLIIMVIYLVNLHLIVKVY